MLQTQPNNHPSIDQMFTTNIYTPWVKHRYIKGKDTNEKVSVQKGEGYAQTVAALIKAAPVVVKAADKAVFGKLGTHVSNTLSERYNKNPEWKPGFAGERHAVLPTRYGLTRANFAGPGTKLQARLARGDTGVDGPNGIDMAAKKHDIDYYNAKTYSDIRKADKKFIKKVASSSSTGMMKNIAIGAIKAKNFGEDVGILSKDVFSAQQKTLQAGSGQRIFEKTPKARKKKKVYPAQVLQRLHRKNAKK